MCIIWEDNPGENELSVTETAVNKSRMVSYPDAKERGN